MAGAWEGVGEEEYGLQWDVDRVDLDFKTGGDEDLDVVNGDCGGAVGDDHQKFHLSSISPKSLCNKLKIPL